jgi:GxxExxY protein
LRETLHPINVKGPTGGIISRKGRKSPTQRPTSFYKLDIFAILFLYCFISSPSKLFLINPITMNENELSYEIIGVALELHKYIGPGLLESTYENVLAFDLRKAGFEVNQQVSMPFVYKEIKMDIGYRIDLLVENKVIIEVKSIEGLAPVHFAQLLTYLKLSELKLGLLINFNCKLLKEGIHRLVNNI